MHNHDTEQNAPYATDKALTPYAELMQATRDALWRVTGVHIVNVESEPPYPLASVPSMGESVVGYTPPNLPAAQIFSGSNTPSGSADDHLGAVEK